MSQLFVAVICCQRDQKNGCLDWFRKSIANRSIPYRIFLGQGCVATHSDEVVLSVDDSYQRLPWKVQGALQWALTYTDATHIFKVDCDARIWPDRLIAFNFDGYDYIGDFSDGHMPVLRPDTYACGPGYCLSRRAAEKVIAAKAEQTVELRTYPPHDKVYAEDEFVGRVLNQTRRYHSDLFASHFAGRAYNESQDKLIVLGNEWSTDRGRR